MNYREVFNMTNTSKDFNIYYLNFSKVYEIAMMINNVILTKIEKDNTNSYEEECGFTSSLSAQGTASFLSEIKASMTAESKESHVSSSRVIESLEVKTTKSILLRRVIKRCPHDTNINTVSEGDLIKIDHVKLEILDEDSLRQFLILRRDAFKGFRVEGVEVNNIVSSMLQDYAYILKGKVDNNTNNTDIIIKIPMELQNEFENKYNINDLLIGHVSIVGIYKGMVEEEFIKYNTYTYFQDAGSKVKESTSKIIKSNSSNRQRKTHNQQSNTKYHFIDTLAIIQDVTFNVDEPRIHYHWWNRFGKWLSNFRIMEKKK